MKCLFPGGDWRRSPSSSLEASQFAPSAMLAQGIHFLSPPVPEDGNGAPSLLLTFHPQHFIHFASTSRWLWLNWLISMILTQNYRQLSRGGIRQGESLGRDGAGEAVKFCLFFFLYLSFPLLLPSVPSLQAENFEIICVSWVFYTF